MTQFSERHDLRQVGIEGYWIVCDDGSMLGFGGVPELKDAAGHKVCALAAQSKDSGWIVTTHGRIAAFGNAPKVHTRLRRNHGPIIGATPAYTGDGGWVARADGTVEPFGKAPDLGDGRGIASVPMTAIAASPVCNGYWLASADGAVRTFGESTWGVDLRIDREAPLVDIAPTPDGRGLWLAFHDGAVFSLGTATFFGTPKLPVEIVAMAAAPDGGGYLLLGPSGQVYPFGLAAPHGPWMPLRARARALVVASSPLVGAAGLFPSRAPKLVAAGSGVFGSSHDSRGFLPPGGLVLPTSDEPDLSVVIPVHGQAEALARTLTALAASPGSLPLEVVIVDDVSPDDTLDMLSYVDGAVIVRNSENVGFVDSCRAGVEASRGNYLLLLNSDAEVTSGAIDSLVETIESDPRIAMVGSRLVYPDGRLQEAGAIVWRDGTAFNYGRSDGDPDRAQYRYVRDVDYCSGASLLVRQDVWKEVGGFDRRFSPAYYEDVDLAFAMRAGGHRVVYDPDALIVHHEGLSHGTDVNSGTKRFQEINRDKFVDKWRHVLDEQLISKLDNVWRARQRSSGPRVLWIDATMLRPDHDAGSLRADTMISLLQELDCAMTFAPLDHFERQPYADRLRRRGIEVLPSEADLHTYLRQLGNDLDVCVLSRPNTAWNYLPLVRELAPSATVVFDTVDLHFLRLQRAADVQGDRQGSLKARHMYRQEMALFQAVDATIAVTEDERERIEELGTGVRTFVVPTIHTPTESVPGAAGRLGLLFVAHFAHLPNLPAALYLVNELMPALRAQLPDISLTIVGADPPDDLVDAAEAQAGVSLPGWVADLAPLYSQSRVFVAPLRFGAGIKGKIGAAMAAGLPVVTSPIGAEGMDLVSGRNVLIACDTAGEVDAICSLVRDDALWTSISNEAWQHVRSRFSPEAIRPILAHLLEQLGLG